ncbi:MAG TPA: 3-oxoacyl-ACP reductase FabG [Candidatus Bathyarchaeia archaeon]|nr:3-oxoacyl-ACP reductase FabG [Candidatus Bathyarchaeia archaeon]
MRLQNKVAVITGGGSGIGKETAKLFLHEGAKVAIFDVFTGNVEKVYRDMGFAKDTEIVNTLCVTADITNREQVRSAVDATLQRFGKIDILVNNAGIIMDALVQKMTEEQWDKVIHVDLTGSFNCIQAVVDHMLQRGGGSIVNVSSVSGIYGNIGQVNYSAAKAGLIGITKTLSKELGKKGIRVNAVAPGFIKSPMTASVPQKILDLMTEKTPLKMLGEPIDIAYANLYLASDEARYVNGCVLMVDGGLVV